MPGVNSDPARCGGRGNVANLGEMSPLATNDGDDVTLTELCFRGLGGGKGRFLSSSSALTGPESFFSKGGLDANPERAWMSSSKGDFPSDLDRRCMGRGGADGFRSDPDRLGGGGIGGARRLNISVRGRVLPSGGGGLFGGSSNFGFAGNGGRGISTPKRLSRSRLTEEQRTGGMGGGASGRSTPASSAVLPFGP